MAFVGFLVVAVMCCARSVPLANANKEEMFPPVDSS